MVGEKSETAVRIAAMARIAVVVRTATMVIETLKVFRKKAIIAIKKETTIVAAKTFKRSGVASFNKREKCIWINSNPIIFAWEGRERETALGRAWKR